MALRNRRLAQLAALAFFLALAVLHTWPLATDPAHLSRLDNDDTSFNTWVVAWVAHQVTTDPLRLFQAPVFYPSRDALAFSEHLFVQSLMAVPLFRAGASPVLAYNLLVIAGHALSGYAMFWLMRRWTGSTAAGVVAGALFSFNAHMLTRFAHMQALHVEFLPIALFALDRLMTERRTRDAVLLCAAFVLQALCSNYMMVHLAVALAAGLAVRPDGWRGGAAFWRRLALAAAAAILLLLPFALAYYRVSRTEGMVRTIEELRDYSATIYDYMATAGRLHYSLWSHRIFEGRDALFPGLTALALTVAAIVSGVAWRDRRARMALAFGVVGFALSFGAFLPGYETLQANVPVLSGLRAASRWGFLTLVMVAILSGHAVAWAEARWNRRWWWHALLVGVIGLATVEALRAPLSLTPFTGISPVHARLRGDDVKAIVVFPLYAGHSFHQNGRYMLDQTRHWKPMVNGYSSFGPESFHQRGRRWQAFPAPQVIEEMRAIGISHIVLHRAPLERDYGAAAVNGLRAHADLEYVLEQDGVIVYRLRPGAAP